MTEPFTPIPNWILDTVPLTNAELAFFARLSRFRINKRGHPHEGKGFPTRQQLEQATGVSGRRVNQLLATMVEKGLLTGAEHAERWELSFAEPREGELPDREGELPRTPISDQEDQEVPTAEAFGSAKTVRGKKPPPSDEEILARADAEGWWERWEDLQTFDGQEGRRTKRGEVLNAMAWMRESKRNWKTEKGMFRFLDTWLRNANKSNAPSHASYQRRMGRSNAVGGYAPVAVEQPTLSGVNFDDPRFGD